MKLDDISRKMAAVSMKRVRGFSCALVVAGMVSAVGAPPSPKPSKPQPVETHWPGITVTVYQIARLPGNRVSVKFIYEASDHAPAETYIADRPLKQFESDDPDQPSPEYFPYSIRKKGVLIDEASGQTFPSAEFNSGDAVHPGQTEVLEIVRPNGAFFLGGVFKCPPINQDDPPKEQKVSFNFPGLKKPLNGVLLPREENMPINFFPRPKTLPLGSRRESR